jgi:hypothetical protein
VPVPRVVPAACTVEAIAFTHLFLAYVSWGILGADEPFSG